MSTEPGRHSSPALLVVGVLGGMLLVGCMMIDPEPQPAPLVANSAAEPVRIFIVRGAEKTPIGSVPSGVSVDLYAFAGSCTDGDLVAESLAGVEIGRLSEPLCTDEVWTIEP